MKYAVFILVSLLFFSLVFRKDHAQEPNRLPWWPVQSIDTMKFSRDLAREKLADSAFDSVIETQIKNIAATGATHVAIATPYDEEFLPILRRWVRSARRHDLKVWFRGNWSGWEGWFDYPGITRKEHLEKTKNFITANPDLFNSGDIFTSCPECENGGPGDPRLTHDVSGYRAFLIDLYKTTSTAFSQINKDVKSNFFSSNGDVAKLIMDPQTTSALGGVVVIDHYVSTPDKLVADIKNLAESSRGKIILGEFGAPIPDIHGRLSETEQSEWLDQALNGLSSTPELIGLNYWTSHGSSTALWSEDGYIRPAVATLTQAYSPRQLAITVKNVIGKPINSATADYFHRQYIADGQGVIHMPQVLHSDQVTVTAPDYSGHGLIIGPDSDLEIVLQKTHESWLFKLQKLTYRILHSILP